MSDVLGRVTKDAESVPTGNPQSIDQTIMSDITQMPPLIITSNATTLRNRRSGPKKRGHSQFFPLTRSERIVPRMPRAGRAAWGDVVYHVLNRGNGGMRVFQKEAGNQQLETRDSEHGCRGVMGKSGDVSRKNMIHRGRKVCQMSHSKEKARRSSEAKSRCAGRQRHGGVLNARNRSLFSCKSRWRTDPQLAQVTQWMAL